MVLKAQAGRNYRSILERQTLTDGQVPAYLYGPILWQKPLIPLKKLLLRKDSRRLTRKIWAIWNRPYRPVRQLLRADRLRRPAAGLPLLPRSLPHTCPMRRLGPRLLLPF
jgi:hypothetical protein